MLWSGIGMTLWHSISAELSMTQSKMSIHRRGIVDQNHRTPARIREDHRLLALQYADSDTRSNHSDSIGYCTGDQQCRNTKHPRFHWARQIVAKAGNCRSDKHVLLFPTYFRPSPGERVTVTFVSRIVFMHCRLRDPCFRVLSVGDGGVWCSLCVRYGVDALHVMLVRIIQKSFSAHGSLGCR